MDIENAETSQKCIKQPRINYRINFNLSRKLENKQKLFS